ncbi:MAG: hypothetical protein ABDH31_02630, partial [Chlorobiota bacterium]
DSLLLPSPLEELQHYFQPQATTEERLRDSLRLLQSQIDSLRDTVERLRSELRLLHSTSRPR